MKYHDYYVRYNDDHCASTEREKRIFLPMKTYLNSVFKENGLAELLLDSPFWQTRVGINYYTKEPEKYFFALEEGGKKCK